MKVLLLVEEYPMIKFIVQKIIKIFRLQKYIDRYIEKHNEEKQLRYEEYCKRMFSGIQKRKKFK